MDAAKFNKELNIGLTTLYAYIYTMFLIICIKQIDGKKIGCL